MADFYGIGTFQPDGDPLIGAYAQWANPAPYTTTDWNTGGFTLCALWTRIFNASGIRSWVEVGYTQGFGGLNANILYWAEGIAGTYYEYAAGVPVGGQGVMHRYMTVYDNNDSNWVVVIDGSAWGWSPQEPLGIEIDVGGEMTNAANRLTATQPQQMAFMDSAIWQPWTADIGAVGLQQDPPLRFQWLAPGVIGQTFADLDAVAHTEAAAPDFSHGPAAGGPGPTGGPFLAEAQAETIARTAAAASGDPKATLVSLQRTTHGAAQKARAAGRSAVVADQREVFVARFEGQFTFRRGPRDAPPLSAATAEVEIDATDGRVLVLGTQSLDKRAAA